MTYVFVLLGYYLAVAVYAVDLYEASLSEIRDGLLREDFSCVDLVKTYFARIEDVSHLHAVIELSPTAISYATALDQLSYSQKREHSLFCIPVMVKDNIAVQASDGLNTTAGSYALLGSRVPSDATVVANLRKHGAVILGKANLSEFSHYRGSNNTDGWSGRGGQATNPYYEGGNPSGSSAGPAIAAAIGLSAVSIGTETDGSIISPASHNNLVAIKPTLGLTSRYLVIPASEHQDSVGPMGRHVADVAAVLQAIAGKDAHDNFTLAQPPLLSYTSPAILNTSALHGVRLGVPRRIYTQVNETGNPIYMYEVFNQTLDVLRSLGASIVDPVEISTTDEITASLDEVTQIATDLEFGMAAYLKGLTANLNGVQSIEDLIAFNTANAGTELPPPEQSQNIFEIAVNATKDAAYWTAVANNLRIGRDGIDGALNTYDLDALVAVSEDFWGFSALAGYPEVTVPQGFLPDSQLPSKGNLPFNFPGQPFGLMFFGTAYSEAKLLSYAYAYEQATHIRLQRKAYSAAIPAVNL